MGLHHEPGLFINSSDRPRSDPVFYFFPLSYRVIRVRRVIRVIRVLIESYTVPQKMDTWFYEMDRDVPDLWTPIVV